ncbi:MAG: hypothetical protein JXA33_13745 [Anaerolineae bacterium]|nr:hypothetical protein [Anaerolineae bacterium]
MVENIPLTPAEQMRRIRQAVNAPEVQSTEQADAVLVDYFSRLDGLRGRIVNLESQMLLKEQPFTSNTPVIGRFIIVVRTFWNWMSTKWYLIPLLRQQNEYNMLVAQTLRETVLTLEATMCAVRDMQLRVTRLEEASRTEKAHSLESDV